MVGVEWHGRVGGGVQCGGCGVWWETMWEAQWVAGLSVEGEGGVADGR